MLLRATLLLSKLRAQVRGSCLSVPVSALKVSTGQTGQTFRKNSLAVLRNTCTQKAVRRAPFSRKAGSDSRRVSCNFPLPEMKRKHLPPPRPTPSWKRKEGNGERNGLIKTKEGEDYEENWETEGEKEDKSANIPLTFRTLFLCNRDSSGAHSDEFLQ